MDLALPSISHYENSQKQDVGRVRNEAKKSLLQTTHLLDTDRQTPPYSPNFKLYILCPDRQTYSSNLKLHITARVTAWSLELEQCFTIFILDGEPRVEEREVLLDVANGGTRRRLNLHLL